MKNKRMVRILALVVVLSMIFTTAAFAAPQNKGFKHFDKKYELKTEDYENALKALINKEIVKGYGNGDYGLSGNVKRGDVIVMIIRMVEKYEDIKVDDDDVENAFDDVYKSDYFYSAIGKAKKLGIAKGDGKLFNPNKPVTVQEAIWLIERAGELLDIDFDSDDIDELESIYEDDLNNFAKRRDVFWMLYYVLDAEAVEDDDDNLNDIIKDMEDESQLDFEDSWFKAAFEGDDNDLQYVKFTLPENSGRLYYDYDEDETRNSLVLENAKYYFGDDEDNIIEKISFVPKDNFKGTVTIKYTAYTSDESYTGLIKITVDYNTLDSIPYTVKENEYDNFEEDDFEEDIDEVRFEIPDAKIGTLYYDEDGDGKPDRGESISSRTVFERDQLDDIIFKPYQYFKGEAVVKYTAYYDDNDDKTYYGEIVITVEAVQDIPTIELEENFEEDKIEINFVEELENEIEDDDPFDIDDVDYVKFELPEEGTLRIKLEGKSLINVDSDDSYQLDEIENITYIFEDDGEIKINYTVFDKTSDSVLEYDGLITIDIN